jgi:hypothetical protein
MISTVRSRFAVLFACRYPAVMRGRISRSNALAVALSEVGAPLVSMRVYLITSRNAGAEETSTGDYDDGTQASMCFSHSLSYMINTFNSVLIRSYLRKSSRSSTVGKNMIKVKLGRNGRQNHEGSFSSYRRSTQYLRSMFTQAAQPHGF